MAIIKDGTGTGVEAKVDSTNKLETHSVTITEVQEALENGDAYNINTGNIGLTSQSASGVFYLQNNEDRTLDIEAFAVGVLDSGTTGTNTLVTLIRNPTSVSFSAAVDMNQNRNFGSSKTLSATTYKGAEGATVTGGDSIAQFYMNSGSRLFATINFALNKGDSMAVTLDTDTTAGTTQVYVAAVCHLKRAD